MGIAFKNTQTLEKDNTRTVELAREFAAFIFRIDYKKNGGGILGDSLPSWMDEFDIELLKPPALGVASYVSFIECAFLHKPSKTLLVTDSVVYVSENIPDAVLECDLMNQRRQFLHH